MSLIKLIGNNQDLSQLEITHELKLPTVIDVAPQSGLTASP